MKEQHRILVVDDDEVIRTMLIQLLESSGFLAQSARDGREALGRVSEYCPDLIILDVNMPEMDGYEVCRILRSGEEGHEIPIIFLSAKSELEDRMMGFRMGADDYVAKPFSFDELHARVKVSLKKMERLDKERKRLKILEEEAKRDETTGVYTRKFFETKARDEIKRSRDLSSPLSLLAIDIDGLQSINTEYGFQQGNRTLTQVGETLASHVPANGILARYEGGEFAVVLPDTDLMKAEEIAEVLRTVVEARTVSLFPSGFIHVTVSIGAALLGPREGMDHLVKRGEQALSRAKSTGKNKICVA
ncbi:MAG: diguanylate cyclase [Candidatus Eremiobacteraeota bacterium]|nr:diguanylate cyclase [Candidatus Eremiobacteraeota bacterium]